MNHSTSMPLCYSGDSKDKYIIFDDDNDDETLHRTSLKKQEA